MEINYDTIDLIRYSGDIDLVESNNAVIEKKDDSDLIDLAWS